MSESLSRQYKDQQNMLTEVVEAYGPWTALTVFGDSSLSGFDRLDLYAATKNALRDTYKRGNEKEIADHILVLEYIEKAITTEMFATLQHTQDTPS